MTNDNLINSIICGNVLDVLRQMPDDFVDCVVTSPPYWGLRNYGVETKTVWGGDRNCKHEWGREIPRNYHSGQFCLKCNAWYGQLGLEPTLDMFIDHLVEIAGELYRVMKPTATLWWNQGDSYIWGHCGQNDRRDDNKRSISIAELYAKSAPQQNLKPKCMALQNYRFLLRCVDEVGFTLRNIVIWEKPNAMPVSAKDRLKNMYEPVFFLTKNPHYYFDLDSIRVPHCRASIQRALIGVGKNNKYVEGAPGQRKQSISQPRANIKHSVGTMFLDLSSGDGTEKTVLEHGCDPRRRFIPCFAPADHRSQDSNTDKNYGLALGFLHPNGKNPGDVWHIPTQPAPAPYRRVHFATFPQKLVLPMITAGCPPDGIVLDPFCGIGTTCVVAKQLGRKYIGIDINPNFCNTALKWLASTHTLQTLNFATDQQCG